MSRSTGDGGFDPFDDYIQATQIRVLARARRLVRDLDEITAIDERLKWVESNCRNIEIIQARGVLGVEAG